MLHWANQCITPSTIHRPVILKLALAFFGPVNVEQTLTMAGALEAGKNIVLFYDDNSVLEDFLFRYVRAGLKEGQPVIYLAGFHTTNEIRQLMSVNGINPDSPNLSIMTYDDVFLNDGRFDQFHIHKTLFEKAESLRSRTKSRHVRLATESNWWCLSDLFENGLEMEEQHDLIPSYFSVVCSYNIVDLLKYVSIYHLTKLAELHEHAFLVAKQAQISDTQFRLSLSSVIIESINEIFFEPDLVRNMHCRLTSDLLVKLQSTVEASKMVELEKRVEGKLFCMLQPHDDDEILLANARSLF